MGRHDALRNPRSGVTTLRTIFDVSVRRRAWSAPAPAPSPRTACAPIWPAASASLSLGVQLGAAVMYFADPHSGRRRRLVLRDRSMHALRGLRERAGAIACDLRHRIWGRVLRWRRVSLSDADVPDDILEARVRATIGHAIHHPRAIHVTALDGDVQLTGVLPERVIEQALSCTKGVPGVRRVINQLLASDAHEPAARAKVEPEHDKEARVDVLATGVLP